MGLTGINGGLDVQGIVSQLMYVEREPVRQLQSKKSTLQKQLNAFDDVSSKLNDLLTAIDNLKDSSGFGAKIATSSNENLLTATASPQAVTGNYDIVIDQLATTDTYKSVPFTSTDSTLETGTFDLQVGSDDKVTITLDESNNTLEGLKNAINNSDAGATAFIVHDNNGYRLGIVSNTPGTDGQIQISNFSSTNLQNQLNLQETVTLQDASFSVNGISITSSTNSPDDAIEGITLNLHGASSGTHIALSIEDDTETVKNSVHSFVDNYNNLINYLNSQFTYSTDQSKNPPLAGNSTLRQIQDKVLSIVSSSVPNLSQDIVNLRQIGVEMDNDGTLSVDDEKLDDALKNNFQQVQNLFQALGTTTDQRVSYLGSTSVTQAGTYAVKITQAAEQAITTGDYAISTLAQDETLTITLNSTSINVNLTAGENLSQIIDDINTSARSNNLGIIAKDDGNSHLQIYSSNYGSSYQLSVTSSTDASGSTGFGTSGKSDTGVDVEGLIDGQSAVGNGTDLTGASGTDVEGLVLKVTAIPDEVSAAGGTLDLGQVTLSFGYAEQLDRLLNNFTDSINGPIILAKNSLNDTIKDIDDRILDLENRLQTKENILISEFSKANEALQNMNAIKASLNNQLGQLKL